MSKQFVKGNVYVFTKKKYMEDTCKTRSKSFVKSILKLWVNQINGNKVIVSGKRDGNVGRMEMWVIPEWCKCIKNNNSKIKNEGI